MGLLDIATNPIGAAAGAAGEFAGGIVKKYAKDKGIDDPIGKLKDITGVGGVVESVEQILAKLKSQINKGLDALIGKVRGFVEGLLGAIGGFVSSASTFVASALERAGAVIELVRNHSRLAEAQALMVYMMGEGLFRASLGMFQALVLRGQATAIIGQGLLASYFAARQRAIASVTGARNPNPKPPIPARLLTAIGVANAIAGVATLKAHSILSKAGMYRALTIAHYLKVMREAQERRTQSQAFRARVQAEGMTWLLAWPNKLVQTGLWAAGTAAGFASWVAGKVAGAAGILNPITLGKYVATGIEEGLAKVGAIKTSIAGKKTELAQFFLGQLAWVGATGIEVASRIFQNVQWHLGVLRGTLRYSRLFTKFLKSNVKEFKSGMKLHKSTGKMLKSAFKHDMKGLAAWVAAEKLLNALYKGKSTAEDIWKKFTGPQPPFSPPFIPQGPVIGGDNISTPGHLVGSGAPGKSPQETEWWSPAFGGSQKPPEEKFEPGPEPPDEPETTKEEEEQQKHEIALEKQGTEGDKLEQKPPDEQASKPDKQPGVEKVHKGPWKAAQPQEEGTSQETGTTIDSPSSPKQIHNKVSEATTLVSGQKSGSKLKTAEASIPGYHPTLVNQKPLGVLVNEPGGTKPPFMPQLTLVDLMAKKRLTAAEIAHARGMIQAIPEATKRGDLFEELQAKVSYKSQRDNLSIGARDDGAREGKSIGDVMCNLTSLGMVLESLGIPNPEPGKFPQYEDYLEHVRRENKFGHRTTAQGWGSVAEKLGAKHRMLGSNVREGKEWWMTTVHPELRAGSGVMMSISGHIVRLQGVRATGLTVDDPFGSVKLKKGESWTFKSSEGGKSNPKKPTDAPQPGEDAHWPWSDVTQHNMRWVASFSRTTPDIPPSKPTQTKDQAPDTSSGTPPAQKQPGSGPLSFLKYLFQRGVSVLQNWGVLNFGQYLTGKTQGPPPKVGSSPFAQAGKSMLQREGEGQAPNLDPAALRERLVREGGSGFPVPSPVAMDLGAYVQFDPSKARVHVGPASERAASELSAKAFTIGSDVFFGSGQYRPSTAEGKALLAHELTHVAQQTGGQILKSDESSSTAEGLEQQARSTQEMVLADLGGEGIGIGQMRCNYRSTDTARISGEWEQKLSSLARQAVSRAGELVRDQGLRLPDIRDLRVDVHLDFRRMSDTEAVEEWALTIVEAASESSGYVTFDPMLQLAPQDAPGSVPPPPAPTSPTGAQVPGSDAADPKKIKRAIVKAMDWMMKDQAKWIRSITEDDNMMLFLQNMDKVLGLFKQWEKADLDHEKVTGYLDYQFVNRWLLTLHGEVYEIDVFGPNHWTNAYDEIMHKMPDGILDVINPIIRKADSFLQKPGEEFEGMGSYVGKRVGYGVANVAMSMGEGLASTADMLLTYQEPVMENGKLVWKSKNPGFGEYIGKKREEAAKGIADAMGIDPDKETTIFGISLKNWTTGGGKVLWGLTMAGKMQGMGAAGGTQAAVATAIGIRMTVVSAQQLVDRIELLRKQNKSWWDIATDPETIAMAAGVLAGAAGAGGSLAGTNAKLAADLAKLGVAANMVNIGALSVDLYNVYQDPTLSDADKQKILTEKAANLLTTIATTANDVHQVQQQTKALAVAEAAKAKGTTPATPTPTTPTVEPTTAPTAPQTQEGGAPRIPTPLPDAPGAPKPAAPETAPKPSPDAPAKAVEPTPTKPADIAPETPQPGTPPKADGPEASKPVSPEATKPPEGPPEPPKPPPPSGPDAPAPPKSTPEMDTLRSEIRALEAQKEIETSRLQDDFDDGGRPNPAKRNQISDKIAAKKRQLSALEQQAGLISKSEADKAAKGLPQQPEGNGRAPLTEAEVKAAMDLLMRSGGWKRIGDLGLSGDAQTALLNARREIVMRAVDEVKAQFPGTEIHGGRSQEALQAAETAKQASDPNYKPRAVGQDDTIPSSKKITSDMDLSVKGPQAADARAALQEKLNAAFRGDPGERAAVNTFLDAQTIPVKDADLVARMQRSGEVEAARKLLETSPDTFATQEKAIQQRLKADLEAARASKDPARIKEAEARSKEVQAILDDAKAANTKRAKELEKHGGNPDAVRRAKEAEYQKVLAELDAVKKSGRTDSETQRRIQKLSYEANQKLQEALSWTPEAYSSHGAREFSLGDRETSWLKSGDPATVRQAALEENAMFLKQLKDYPDAVTQATHAAKYLARHLNEVQHILGNGEYVHLQEFAKSIKGEGSEQAKLTEFLFNKPDIPPTKLAQEFVAEMQRLMNELNTEMFATREVTGPFPKAPKPPPEAPSKPSERREQRQRDEMRDRATEREQERRARNEELPPRPGDRELEDMRRDFVARGARNTWRTVESMKHAMERHMQAAEPPPGTEQPPPTFDKNRPSEESKAPGVPRRGPHGEEIQESARNLPKEWSAQRIFEAADSIANNPSSQQRPGPGGTIDFIGVVDGVRLVVRVDPKNKSILSVWKE